MVLKFNVNLNAIALSIFLVIITTEALKLKHFQEGGKQTAQTFRGFSQVTVPKSETNELEYYISFSRYSDGCDYKACFYGWVNNFTV